MSLFKPSDELRWLLSKVRPFLPLQLLYLATLLISSALALVDPLIIKWLVDEIIPWRREDMILLAGATFLLVYIFRYSLSGLGSLLDYYTVERVAFSIRSDLLNHIQNLSASYHDNMAVGDVLHRIDQDASRSASISSQIVTTLIRVSTTTGLALLIMLFLSWQLTLIILPLAPSLLYLRRFIYPRLRKSADELQQRSGRRTAFLQDHLGSVVQVQLLNQEARERRRFLRTARSVLEAQVRQRSWDVFLMIASALISITAISISLTYGSFQVVHGTLTLGSFIAFYSYATRFFDPLQGLATLYSSIQSASASIRRLQSVLEVPSDVQEPPRPVKFPSPLSGIVEYRGVSFSYNSQRILDDVHVRFEPGERVALVGESGCGKTSLVKLLPRLYDIQAGQIIIDGIDIRKVLLRHLRTHVTLVPQDPVLFDVSLRENLLYGKPSASKQQLAEAISIAQLEEVVTRVGLDQPVGPRGARLSGGERQRVAVARAILRDSRVLILDEATSALDPRTETSLLQALEPFAKCRTIILIAHRMSVALWANRIIVLKDGSVIEEGPHNLLYQARGYYRWLCDQKLQNDNSHNEAAGEHFPTASISREAVL